MAIGPDGKIFSSGGKKVSKELKITTGRIKRLVRGLDGCRDAQQAVKDAFPEAFEEEWVDVTNEISWVAENYKDGVLPHLLYGKNLDAAEVVYVNEGGFQICPDYKQIYKVEQKGQTFRILKKT